MAKSSLFDSIKFRWLVRTLKMPVPHVAGYLECMWQTAYASCSEHFPSDEALEIAAHWDGEPGVFAKAVTNETYNLVDRCANGRLKIHNFWQHAPQYVKQRKKYNDEQKKNGIKRRNKKTYHRDETLANREELPPTKGNEGQRREGKGRDIKAEIDPASAVPRKRISEARLAECNTVADRFLQLESKKNRGPGNFSMWQSRVVAMAQYSGGLIRCDEILGEIQGRKTRHGAVGRGCSTEPIENEAAWANKQISLWLEAQDRKSA
jgi:hypothetical protein